MRCSCCVAVLHRSRMGQTSLVQGCGTFVEWVRQEANGELELLANPARAASLIWMPQRRIVECTFAWLGKCQRPGKDDEHPASFSVAMILLAFIRLMTRRVAWSRCRLMYEGLRTRENTYIYGCRPVIWLLS